MSDELCIAVCDDSKTDLDRIAEITSQIFSQAEILHSIKKYSAGKSLLDDIQSGVRFHILLLDVMMDGMNGMELAAKLRKRDNKTFIIFVSGNREMALCGYEVSAVRYLAKPLDENKMKEALLYCSRSWQDKKEILLPTNQSRYRISISDIQFVEAFGRGTKFVLENETVVSKLKFSEIEAMLPKSTFILCHRSYIVNLSYVNHISRYEFLLKNGQLVPISKGRYSEIYKRFVNYITD